MHVLAFSLGLDYISKTKTRHGNLTQRSDLVQPEALVRSRRHCHGSEHLMSVSAYICPFCIKEFIFFISFSNETITPKK